VVYSGGCNSTQLLHDLAKIYGTKKDPVIALSYNHYAPCNIKIKVEKATRKKFKKYCRKNKIYVNFVEIDSKLNGRNRGCYPKGFKEDFSGICQPYLWLGGLGTLLMGNYNIHFGYIKSDDFWKFKTEFIEAFKALQKIVVTESKLFFPLMSDSKEAIILELKKQGIYEYTRHCESPTKTLEACGSCTPCRHHGEALRNIEYKLESRRLKIEIEGLLEQVLPYAENDVILEESDNIKERETA
jgi:7-cyano-7-deazaguanine synthase in queuosine biosynthesis